MTDSYWPVIAIVLYFVIVSLIEIIFKRFPSKSASSYYWTHRIMGALLFVISLAALIFVLNLLPIGIYLGNFYQKLGTLVGGVAIIIYIGMDVYKKFITNTNWNNLYAMGMN